MSNFLSSILPIFLLFFFQIAEIQPMDMPTLAISALAGDNIEIPFVNATKITRNVYNAKNAMQEQVFRVCNGKNKKTCGFWENTKTKKRVARVTNYNKKKGMMIIPKAKKADSGVYTGPFYMRATVFVI